MFIKYNIFITKSRMRNVHKERSMMKGTLMKISLVIKVYERQEQQRKTTQKNKTKNRVKVDLGGERSVFEKVAQFNEKYC